MHYLTPVYFRREVLKRYYEQPERYSMEDGLLRCGSLWMLRLDNDHPDHVMVFLGDLGHDLPESERPYWQTFNRSDHKEVLATGNVNPDPVQEVVTMILGARRLLFGLAAHIGIDLDAY